jgi:hypothetical protein
VRELQGLTASTSGHWSKLAPRSCRRRRNSSFAGLSAWWSWTGS